MKRKLLLVVVVGIAFLLAGFIGAAAQTPGTFLALQPASPLPLGTAFTYQGQLKQNNAPANGTYMLAFRLYDADDAGSQVGVALTHTLPVTNGLFTARLDFGPGVFNGDARWLGIAVNGAAELQPRQALSATPYALHAADAWSVNGNRGTDGGSFLGTKDGMTLTLAVSGTAALRVVPALAPNGNPSPNIIGGYSGNIVEAGAWGATIAGGGGPGKWNAVSPLGTVGGGAGNLVGGSAGTIAGGYTNYARGVAASIGGGNFNNTDGDYATVGGGIGSSANALNATIGGGSGNLASGANATVPGGAYNTAAGASSFAAGGQAAALHDGAFVWADDSGMPISSTAANQFVVRATGGINLVTAINGSGVPTAGLSVAPDGTATVGGLNVNSGTTFTRLQAGTNTVGASGTVLRVFTGTFPIAFAGTPRFVALTRSEDNTDLDDTFVITTRRLSPTQYVVNILRVDANSGWAQGLRIDWIAWE